MDLPHRITIMNSRSCGGFTLKKNTLFQGGLFCEVYSAPDFNNSFDRVYLICPSMPHSLSPPYITLQKLISDSSLESYCLHAGSIKQLKCFSASSHSVIYGPNQTKMSSLKINVRQQFELLAQMVHNSNKFHVY